MSYPSRLWAGIRCDCLAFVEHLSRATPVPDEGLLLYGSLAYMITTRTGQKAMLRGPTLGQALPDAATPLAMATIVVLSIVRRVYATYRALDSSVTLAGTFPRKERPRHD